MIKDMTVGNPSKVLFSFAIPMVLGNVFQQLYSIVDSIVVGNFVGPEALSAVGASYPITFVFIAVATGAAVGCSVIISQMFGAKYIGKMKTAINTSILSVIFFSMFLMIIGIIFSGDILHLLETPEYIFNDANIFMRIYILGVVFLFLYNTVTYAFNALGDSKTPLYFLMISSVVNIILDLIFVIIFKLGVAGVAIATLIAQGISATLSLFYLLKKVKSIKTEEKYKIFDFIILKKILKIAVPSILQQSIVSVGNLFVQKLVNSYGWETIAGYTAATKIDSIIIMPMANLSTAVSTFTAQNIGAKEFERVKKGYKSSLIMIGTFCGAVALIVYLFGENFINMFISSNYNQKVINVGTEYLRIVSLSYFLMGLMVITNGILRGAGDVKIFILSSLTNLSLRIIFAYTLALVIGQEAIWIGIPIGWLFASIISTIRYSSGKWKYKSIL